MAREDNCSKYLARKKVAGPWQCCEMWSHSTWTRLQQQLVSVQVFQWLHFHSLAETGVGGGFKEIFHNTRHGAWAEPVSELSFIYGFGFLSMALREYYPVPLALLGPLPVKIYHKFKSALCCSCAGIWPWSPCAFWPHQSSPTRLSRQGALVVLNQGLLGYL